MNNKGLIIVIVILILLLPFIFLLLESWFYEWSPYPIFWATLVCEVSLICTAVILSRLNQVIKLLQERRQDGDK